MLCNHSIYLVKLTEDQLDQLATPACLGLVEVKCSVCHKNMTELEQNEELVSS